MAGVLLSFRSGRSRPWFRCVALLSSSRSLLPLQSRRSNAALALHAEQGDATAWEGSLPSRYKCFEHCTADAVAELARAGMTQMAAKEALGIPEEITVWHFHNYARSVLGLDWKSLKAGAPQAQTCFTPLTQLTREAVEKLARAGMTQSEAMQELGLDGVVRPDVLGLFTRSVLGLDWNSLKAEAPQATTRFKQMAHVTRRAAEKLARAGKTQKEAMQELGIPADIPKTTFSGYVRYKLGVDWMNVRLEALSPFTPLKHIKRRSVEKLARAGKSQSEAMQELGLDGVVTPAVFGRFCRSVLGLNWKSLTTEASQAVRFRDMTKVKRKAVEKLARAGKTQSEAMQELGLDGVVRPDVFGQFVRTVLGIDWRACRG